MKVTLSSATALAELLKEASKINYKMSAAPILQV